MPKLKKQKTEDAVNEDLDALLQTAQDVVNSAKASTTECKPDKKELEAIKKFCSIELERREIQKTSIDELKKLRTQQKECKEVLQTLVPKTNNVLALSKLQMKQYTQECNSIGIPPVPAYLRYITCNKDSSITAELIQEALLSISSEDLASLTESEHQETNQQNKQQKLSELILDSVRRHIRTYTENLKISESLPKGVSNYDAEETNDQQVLAAFNLWKCECSIKTLLSQRKTQESVHKASAQESKETKQIIEQYFVRTGLTKQLLVIDSQSLKLCRKVSIRKPKVGIGKLENLLGIMFGEHPKLLTSVQVRTNEIVRLLQIQISSLPPETKSTISLQTLAPK